MSLSGSRVRRGYYRAFYGGGALFKGPATLTGFVMTAEAPSGTTVFWIGVPLAFCIPIHFLAYFFPWLGHPDPDVFAKHQLEQQEHDRPVVKPGI